MVLSNGMHNVVKSLDEKRQNNLKLHKMLRLMLLKIELLQRGCIR